MERGGVRGGKVKRKLELPRGSWLGGLGVPRPSQEIHEPTENEVARREKKRESPSIGKVAKAK